MPAPELEVVIDPGEFSRLMKAVRGFDKDLSSRLRKNLRAAAKPAVDDVKRTLLAPTDHAESPTHLRRTLAAGTKVSIRTGKSAGVSITTSGTKLANPRLAKLYNRASWRHPVYGNQEVWVTQTGRPYFGVVYNHTAAVTDAAKSALDEAAEQIASATK